MQKSAEPALFRAQPVKVPVETHAMKVHQPGSAIWTPGRAASGENGKDSIVLRQVVKNYANAAGNFLALKGVDLQFNYGEFVSVVGKSGSGKSTLLNMITGIDHPTSGKVLVDGIDIYAMNESRRALWRGKTIGIVFQFFQLLPTLTLLENTMLPMDYCQVYPITERPERAMELLRLVGLEEQAHKLPSSVSSGQQQCAAIARALATDAPIIVADEPTGNLDSRSAEIIIQLFSQLASQGKTVLIVTHDASITVMTDRTVIISDGEIIDESLAKAMPLLNHQQMLQATHMIQERIVPAGKTIIQQGEQVSSFYMIRRGEVSILLNNPASGEIIAANLGPGDFFGEVELMRGGNSIASVRAWDKEPVELVTLPHDTFCKLIQGSPLTEEALSKIVQNRISENRSHKARLKVSS